MQILGPDDALTRALPRRLATVVDSKPETRSPAAARPDHPARLEGTFRIRGRPRVPGPNHPNVRTCPRRPLFPTAATGLSGTYHAFRGSDYAARYAGGFAYRFNRRFDLLALPQRLLIAAVDCSLRTGTEPALRPAEIARQSKTYDKISRTILVIVSSSTKGNI